MNILYKTYSSDVPPSKNSAELISFGVTQLKKLFKHYTGEDGDAFYKLYKHYFIFKTFRKGEYLIEDKEIEPNIYFIISGSVKLLDNIGGNYRIINLCYNGNLVFSSGSIIYGSPANHIVEATTETYTFCLSLPNLLDIHRGIYYNSITRLFTSILIEGFRFYNMNNRLLHLPHHQKPAFLLEHYPGIFDHFKKKDIANFSGMKAETLSRAIENKQL